MGKIAENKKIRELEERLVLFKAKLAYCRGIIRGRNAALRFWDEIEFEGNKFHRIKKKGR